MPLPRAGLAVVVAVLLSRGIAAAQPANDACAAATVIAALPFTDAIAVTGATSEPGDPTFQCEWDTIGPGASVWYRYTAPAAVSLQVDTFGSDLNTLLAVHGSACGAFTGVLSCNDDDYDADNYDQQSRLVVTLAAGETVHIEVFDLDLTGGNLVLHVNESPVFQVSRMMVQGRRPGVAALGDGNFLVVWDESTTDRVVGRLYDAAGAATGPRFDVSSAAAGYYPAVAAGGGGFVTVWPARGGLLGRRLDAGGTPLGAEFLVSGTRNYPAAVAADPAGNFMVVWADGDGDGYGVFARRYDALGTALGLPFQVNTYTEGYQMWPAVAAAATGNFVVVWSSGPWCSPCPAQDGDGFGIFGQRLDASGAPLGGEFQVNTYTTFDQLYPAVAADAAGNFMVFWWDDGQDDCFFCVQGRRFDAAGAPQGGEIRVGTDHGGYAEGRPLAATVDSAGNFVVAFPQPGHVRSRRFDPSGTPLGAPFQVTHLRDGYQYHPAVAALPGGDFAVVWDWSPWGSHYDVMGRRVTTAVTGNCPEQPLSQWDCRQPVVAGKSRLVIKNRTPDRADAIAWKWARGEATDLGALGDPLATHAYTLCLYDAAAARLHATVPAGRTCDTKPCWTALGADGFKYVDRAGTTAGVQKLVLRTGAAAEARVIAKGKGEALDMPALPLTPPVRMQLHAMNGECWETRFEAAGVTTNTTSDFKATGPP